MKSTLCRAAAGAVGTPTLSHDHAGCPAAPLTSEAASSSNTRLHNALVPSSVMLAIVPNIHTHKKTLRLHLIIPLSSKSVKHTRYASGRPCWMCLCRRLKVWCAAGSVCDSVCMVCIVSAADKLMMCPGLYFLVLLGMKPDETWHDERQRARARARMWPCGYEWSVQFVFCLPGCWPLLPLFEVSAERRTENRAASLARSPRLGLAAVALWWMRRGEMRARTRTHKWVLCVRPRKQKLRM